MPYKLYLIRRFCRIYLPFAVAASLSILGAAIFRKSDVSLTRWFNDAWHIPISMSLVVWQFLMVPMGCFNPAFWSLTFEMQMSLVMPFLCLVMTWANPAVFTLVYGLMMFVFPLNTDQWPPGYVALSCQIVFLFALGATLAKYDEVLRGICARHARWLWLVLAASMCLYYDFFLKLPFRPVVIYELIRRVYLINGLGSAGILLCSLYLPPLARLLKHSVPEYLGRISYSLYLVHSIVLFATVYLLFGHLSLHWIMGVILVLAFVVAHVFCVTVEEPAMRLGKRLCELIQHRAGEVGR